jgi:cysteine desulfurase
MRIYCDHNAGTPLRPEVLGAMLPYLREPCGNASSVHALGARARAAVEAARAHVAALIGVQPAEIVFTSGGTESNNLAILGAVRMRERRTIVSTPIEHSSVREVIRGLRDDGYCVREAPVDGEGRAAAAAVAAQLDESVGLVSVGWANNEIGTIQPIEAIAAACRARGVRFHVDAGQAAGHRGVVCPSRRAVAPATRRWRSGARAPRRYRERRRNRRDGGGLPFGGGGAR